MIHGVKLFVWCEHSWLLCHIMSTLNCTFLPVINMCIYVIFSVIVFKRDMERDNSELFPLCVRSLLFHVISVWAANIKTRWTKLFYCTSTKHLFLSLIFFVLSVKLEVLLVLNVMTVLLWMPCYEIS